MTTTHLNQAGAVFHRCALQVNPRHYQGTFRGQDIPGEDRDYANNMVEEAVRLKISVLAITDHNDASGVQDFRVAAQDQPVTILPGFEISSSEGIHVLCLYPPETKTDQLGRFLGELGIRETEPSTNLSKDDFASTLSTVRKQGGITIAAHVTHDRGLLKVLTGQARMQAWKSDDLLAVQIPRGVDDLDDKHRCIVRNQNPDYRRAHPAGTDLAVALVNAKDVTEPSGLGDPSATCWIKMSEIGIEGLRQAFLDPDSRIRLSEPDGAAGGPRSELVSIGWEGGFLDGAETLCNPNLNILIGGRGAGKSTVVESIRYVLDLDPIGDEARSAHQGIVRHVLQNGTKISLFVRCHRPTEENYRIERTVPNPSIVLSEDGNISELSPVDILPGVQVFGQHEVAELTRDNEQLTGLLQRFVKPNPALSRRKEEIRASLEKTRRSILEAESELSQIEDRLSELPRLQETFARYREAGIEEHLRDRSHLVKEERIIKSLSSSLNPFRGILHELRTEVPIDRAFLSQRALGDLPGRETLREADAILAHVSEQVETAANQIEVALDDGERHLAKIRDSWNKRKDEVEQEYETKLRELQKQAIDGEEFIGLQKEIEELRPLDRQRSSLRQSRDGHVQRRKHLLIEWEDLKRKEFRLLHDAAVSLSDKLRDTVQVEVTAIANRKPLTVLLRDGIGGRLDRVIGAIERHDDFSLPDFVERCRSGADALREGYSITQAQASALSGASEGVLMRIEELDLPATTTIRLNTAPPKEPPIWRAIKDLSIGQKATAVLMLLLLESEAPLIVDQPEDDLDNRFITEGIVPRMREEKQRRQFIFSTHNANIPVLGDAELVVGLSAADEPVAGRGRAHIAPEHIGSIDQSSVRELLEELLEGGKAAFETRRRKYGF